MAIENGKILSADITLTKGQLEIALRIELMSGISLYKFDYKFLKGLMNVTDSSKFSEISESPVRLTLRGKENDVVNIIHFLNGDEMTAE